MVNSGFDATCQVFTLAMDCGRIGERAPCQKLISFDGLCAQPYETCFSEKKILVDNGVEIRTSLNIEQIILPHRVIDQNPYY